MRTPTAIEARAYALEIVPQLIAGSVIILGGTQDNGDGSRA